MTVNAAVVVADAAPSITVTSEIVMDGAPSSSMIVPSPTPSATVAFSAPESWSVKVSSAPSSSASPRMGTDTVCESTPPGKNVNVPEVAA